MKRLLTTIMSLSALFLATAACTAQHSDEKQTEAEIAELQEMIQAEIELEGDESQVLRDALRKIAAMRAQRDEEDNDRNDGHSDQQVHIDVDLDEETVEALGKHFEEQMESLGESIEEWAEGFEVHVEKWAEEHGEDMEAWAEEFGASWEEWADTQGQAWEEWGEQFGASWEAWGKKLEEGSLNEEDIKALIEGNVDMIKEMPIEGLYEQLSRSKDQLKDLPWDSVEGLEKLVEESVLQSLEGIEALAESELDFEGEQDVSAAVRALQESVEKVQLGLDAKSKGLDVARLKALKDLRAVTEAQRDDLKSLEQQLKREKKTHERSRALEAKRLATDPRNNQRVDEDELAKRYLDLLRELEASPSAEAKLELERFFAEQAERSSRESELDSLREEIDKLRAEVEMLREQDE